MAKSLKNVRLLKNILPERYEVMLRPNLEEFTFYGEETAYLHLDKPTKQIVFHARELEVLTAQISQKRHTLPAKISLDPTTETVKFMVKQPLQPGRVELNLTFNGSLNDKMRGFYRSRYLLNGEEKYLATTQFESTDARQAFPCIDEPSAKAIFDITLMVPAQTTAISNTIEQVVTEHESGFKIVKFAPTPKMSTYLLAFLVGEFDHIEGKTEEGILVRIFTTPGKQKQAEFALDVAKKVLTFYNHYFNIPYPLPVLDMIAVPDFSAGAMENWGAVTYRETALLIDPGVSSAANRQRVAVVIAHELAHMWFGDLVTMEWWTHLWLNEGFATYIEYLAVDHLFPEWDLWSQFVYSDHGRALKLDALANTHPIEVEVHHPDEISEIFDAVSYSKGASIIRMLADYLGTDNFRDGLRYYLNKHKYANAATIDLWKAFEHITGQPVTKIMHNWTSKPGYPLLEVEESGPKLRLNQARFLSSPVSAKQSTDKTIWSVPISLAAENLPTSQHLLTKRTTTFPKPASASWYKLNHHEVGFYRVKYPPSNLKQLTLALENHQLDTANRLGLIRDAFDLAEAGQLKTDLSLKLALGYQEETDYTVWSELAGHLAQIDDLLAGDPLQKQFHDYGRGLFSNIAKQLGWTKRPTDKHTDVLLRSLALYMLGTYGDQSTIEHAQHAFQKSLATHQPIEADLRGVVYNLIAQNGGVSEYQQFKTKYLAETNQQERDRLARAMSEFKQASLLTKTLEFSLSKNVRLQDAIFVIAAVVGNQHGRDLAWQFLKKNWDSIRQRYGGGHFLLPHLIESLDVFNTKPQLQDVSAFFKNNLTTEAARTIAQTLEKIRSNIAWLERDHTAIKQFLQDY